MASSDPVGDMICMIKNAIQRRRRRVAVPHSRLKEGVAKTLKAEGYIEDVQVVQDEKIKVLKTLHLFMKYDVDGVPIITQIRRMSKPGCRVFRGRRPRATRRRRRSARRPSPASS